MAHCPYGFCGIHRMFCVDLRVVEGANPYRFGGDFLVCGEMMYALFERGNTDSFSKKNYRIFSDINALVVLMSEKFFAQLSFKKARILPLQRVHFIHFFKVAFELSFENFV